MIKRIGELLVKWPDSVVKRLYQFSPVIILFAFWTACSIMLGYDRLPRPDQIFSTALSSFFKEPIIEFQGGGDQGVYPHLLRTIYHAAYSLSIGVLGGGVLGVLIFQTHTIRDILEPALEMFRVVPPLILIPFVLLLFTSSEKAQIFVAALYASYSMCIYTLNALHNVERNYLFMADLFGSSRFQKIWKVQIPAILPELVGGLRVTSALTLGIIIVAEYLGSPSGIGRVIKFAISFSSIDLMIVSILWVVLMSVAIDILIVLVFRSYVRWSSRSFR